MSENNQFAIENSKNIIEKNGKKLYNVLKESLLIELLKRNRMQITVAESCTGGLLAAEIIKVPGASSVFYEGLVTYSNESKIKRLGVDPLTLENFGAVSRETAAEMLKNISTEFGISVTGIAGPEGGTSEKPVGLVFIGLRYKNEIIIHRYTFSGTRDEIRKKAVEKALEESTKLLLNEGLR